MNEPVCSYAFTFLNDWISWEKSRKYSGANSELNQYVASNLHRPTAFGHWSEPILLKSLIEAKKAGLTPGLFHDYVCTRYQPLGGT